MENYIDKVKSELIKYSDEKAQIQSQHYFKESITVYGVKAKFVHKIAKETFQLIKSKPKTEIFNLCEELWKSDYIEEHLIACRWAYFIHKKYQSEDFKVFENWLKNYVNNWATCDTLCNHNVGEFLEMYPSYIKHLKKWATSENRWLRRGAAVSLIVPAKKGKFMKEAFEIADILLLDSDDLVQKGYGWLLKVVSKNFENEVYNYVVKNKSVMPRTALRYAIEKMPKELRLKAMEK